MLEGAITSRRQKPAVHAGEEGEDAGDRDWSDETETGNKKQRSLSLSKQNLTSLKDFLEDKRGRVSERELSL